MNGLQHKKRKTNRPKKTGIRAALQLQTFFSTELVARIEGLFNRI
jgi:hypothetical protein